jgi:hypothetical protein
MTRNRLGAGVGAAVLAGALAATGCGSAAATIPAATTGTVSMSAATSAAARGHAEIMLYSIRRC